MGLYVVKCLVRNDMPFIMICLPTVLLQGVQLLVWQLKMFMSQSAVNITKYPFNHLITLEGDFVWHIKHHAIFNINSSWVTDGNNFDKISAKISFFSNSHSQKIWNLQILTFKLLGMLFTCGEASRSISRLFPPSPPSPPPSPSPSPSPVNHQKISLGSQLGSLSVTMCDHCDHCDHVWSLWPLWPCVITVTTYDHCNHLWTLWPCVTTVLWPCVTTVTIMMMCDHCDHVWALWHFVITVTNVTT